MSRCAGTASGNGRFYPGCPATATSVCTGSQIVNGMPATAKNFVGGAPWLTQPQVRRGQAFRLQAATFLDPSLPINLLNEVWVTIDRNRAWTRSAEGAKL